MIDLSMPTDETQSQPRITVFGVGGAGGNAVNNMITSELGGVEFVVANTDAQALQNSLCERKLQLGATVTRGLGAGARPEIGKAAAEEQIEEIQQYLEGANMCFITAGMGGGTGTGAAPVIASQARENGILTVGVVTKPFHFEGSRRMKMAEEGIEELSQYVDTLIIIPNQNLFRIATEKTTFADAFNMADDVLKSGVRGITDLMIMPGLINLDFADIRSVMSEMGKAMMGTGEATGDGRAIDAAEAAISNPLLDDVSMKGARGVLINITGGMDMTLFEVDEAANRIREEVDPNANIIFGSTFDAQMDGTMRVSVVATGIDSNMMTAPGTNPIKVVSDNKSPTNIMATAANPAPAAGLSQPSRSFMAPAQPAPSHPPHSAHMRPAPASGLSQPTVDIKQASAQMAPPSRVTYSAPQQPSTMTPQQPTPTEQAAPTAQTSSERFVAPQPVEAPATIHERSTDARFVPPMAQPTQTELSGFGASEKMREDSSLVAPTQETSPKKKSGFMDRLFGRGKDEAEDDFTSATETPMTTPQPQQQAQPQPQQQPVETATEPTNVAAQPTSAEEETEDRDMDIPAFLRRQAN